MDTTASPAMECPACRTRLDEDSIHCHHCGRCLDKARRRDLFLDVGIVTARFVLSCCVALLWLGLWFWPIYFTFRSWDERIPASNARSTKTPRLGAPSPSTINLVA